MSIFNKRFLNRGGTGLLTIVFIIFIILGIFLICGGIFSIITKVLLPRVLTPVVKPGNITGLEAQIFGIYYIILGLLFMILGIAIPKRLDNLFFKKRNKN